MLSQKNEVLEAIQERGFDPREFEWEKAGEDDLLIHRPSEYWFRFSTTGGMHDVRYMPGNSLEEEGGLVGPKWTEVRSGRLVIWLHALERELGQPDLWAHLAAERELVGGEQRREIENTPFSPEEQIQIATQIEEAKKYVRHTHELPEAQLEELDARLDYLVEAASRMRRVDWRNAVVGALVGTIIEGILPADPVKVALTMIFRGLGALFGTDAVPELL